MVEKYGLRSGNGKGLLLFCDGPLRLEINEVTARSYRVAATKVLAAQGADPEDVDVLTLDVSEAWDRFARGTGADMTEGSRISYRSRWRQAVASYRAWLKDDPEWKPTSRTVVRPRTHASKGSASSEAPAVGRRLEPTDPHAVTSSSASNGDQQLMTYDVPLRPDLVVQLKLPLRLTTADADRLSAFLHAIAFSVPHTGGSRESAGGRNS